MDLAFMYVEENKIALESDYQYVSGHTQNKGTCKYHSSMGVGHCGGFKNVRKGVSSLKSAIGKGPVSVAIEADKMVFQHYKSGVLNSAECGTQLDHGVLAVGYNDEAFIVKNSWATIWGDDGYVQIAASAENICGILSQPSYPTV